MAVGLGVGVAVAVVFGAGVAVLVGFGVGVAVALGVAVADEMTSACVDRSPGSNDAFEDVPPHPARVAMHSAKAR